ncbi:MAG: BatD family protein [Candidatus Saelkia tenebricola]|nr:BatD family protein [Candidatus Saelkia tenebricola]
MFLRKEEISKYRNSVMRIKFLLLFLIVFVKVSLSQEITINVSVDKETVSVGDAINYQISVLVESKVSPEIIIPEFKDFKITSRNQMRNYKIQNSKVESSLSYNFLLIPIIEGNLEIEGFKVKFDSKEYEVEGVKIKVEGIKDIPEKNHKQQDDKEEVEKLWI